MLQDRGGPFSSMNGLRVLSMFLVILGHTVLFFASPAPGALNFKEKLIPPVRRGLYFMLEGFSLGRSFILSRILLSPPIAERCPVDPCFPGAIMLPFFPG
jgi:hypothetical protein